MKKEKGRIGCPIFQKHEPAIKKLTADINAASGIANKAKFAEKLREEAEVLLSCPDRKNESIDCKNCHTIAFLRKKTADLIIRAKKLA